MKHIDIIQKKLSNGVEVVIEKNPTVQSAAVGVFTKTGSANELDNEAGISHLIEHMMFKGTKERNSKEIAEVIEGRGGILNAYTDKEVTCYYNLLLKDDIEHGIDLLSDMVLNSVYHPDELEKEIHVVLEEIKRGEDEPSDHIHELHLEQRWGDHPYGKPVIGTNESVAKFTRSDILRYLERRYYSGNILLSVAGHVDPDEVLSIAEEKLTGISSKCKEGDKFNKPIGSCKKKEISKDIEQVHFCIGSDISSIYEDSEIYPCSVMNTILGGGMSSRLFQEIREKRGLAYSVGSYKLNYSCGGIFNVFGGTSKEHWDLVQELVFKEFDKLKQGDITQDELEKTANHICGNIVLGTESMSSRMQRNGRQVLFHDKIIPVQETVEKIRSVTMDDVITYANKVLDPDLMNITALGPF